MSKEKFYVYLEDESRIEDPNFDSYNKGTQLMLEILVEQNFEFESFEQYENIVNDLEKCRDEDDVEDYLSGNIPIVASEFHYDSDDIELESELNTDKEPKKSCDVIVEELRLKEKYLNKKHIKQEA